MLPFCSARKKKYFFCGINDSRIAFCYLTKIIRHFFSKDLERLNFVCRKKMLKFIGELVFFCENSLMSSIFVQSRQFVGGLNPGLSEPGDRGPPGFDRSVNPFTIRGAAEGGRLCPQQ